MVTAGKMSQPLSHLERHDAEACFSWFVRSDGPQPTELQWPTAITYPLKYSVGFSHFPHFLIYVSLDHPPNKLLGPKSFG